MASIVKHLEKVGSYAVASKPISFKKVPLFNIILANRFIPEVGTDIVEKESGLGFNVQAAELGGIDVINLETKERSIKDSHASKWILPENCLNLTSKIAISKKRPKYSYLRGRIKLKGGHKNGVLFDIWDSLYVGETDPYYIKLLGSKYYVGNNKIKFNDYARTVLFTLAGLLKISSEEWVKNSNLLCSRGEYISIMKDDRGYFIGAIKRNNGKVCRISKIWKTERGAVNAAEKQTWKFNVNNGNECKDCDKCIKFYSRNKS